MLNVWVWADVSRWRQLTRSVELTHVATPATVILDAVAGLTEAKARAAVTCHDVTPIYRHCHQQQRHHMLSLA